MSEIVLVLLVVFLAALIQSVVGVGLLLFGTPSMILLGFSFSETLAILLPASLSLSTLQLIASRNLAVSHTRDVLIWAMVPLVGALSLVLMFEATVLPSWFVSIGLLGALAIQLRSLLKDSLMVLSIPQQRASLVVIGLIHGLSNLGGGFLVTYASARGSNPLEIRTIVAAGYTVFALVQLAVIAFLAPDAFSGLSLLAGVMAGLTYVSLGRLIFLWVPASVFRLLVPGLTAMFLFSLLLFPSGLGA